MREKGQSLICFLLKCLPLGLKFNEGINVLVRADQSMKATFKLQQLMRQWY